MIICIQKLPILLLGHELCSHRTRRGEAKLIRGGEVRYIFHLLSSFSILPVCKFELKYAKITKTRAAGTIDTSTALIGTGTDSVLEGGTGTDLERYLLLLHQRYRYRSKGVPVPVFESAQKWQISPFFMHFSSINHFYYIFHQKLTWNPSKQLHKHF